MNKMIFKFSLATLVSVVLLLTSCSKMDLPENYYESPIPNDKQTQRSSLLGDFRNKRYCELLFTFVNGNDTITEVYNTMGCNECPSEDWSEIDGEELKIMYGAIDVHVNGPRFWVINRPGRGDENIRYDKIGTFGNIQMKLAAQIDGVLEVADKYSEHNIIRFTTWKYKKNNQIYKLINPFGEEYIMQSYTTMINPDLKIEGLENLENQLTLPTGWSFESETLEQKIELVSNGDAIVVQDDLGNTYQKVND
jgi:hypothetical protein